MGISLRLTALAGLILAVTGMAGATTYEALFTSEAPLCSGRFAPPTGYATIYQGGPSSGGLDQVTDFGLSNGPDYTGWNADHTGVGNYDDPSRGWSFNNNDNNGGYTDAYSTAETTDSGYVEFEWTFENVAVSPHPAGYYLTVTVDDLDDYVAKKGPDWASVPDEWKVYVNGGHVGDLYDFDDPQGSGPDRSINTFLIGNVSGSVKVEINGTYFNLLHDDAYYGVAYGKYASWGDTASTQHGVRLEGLMLTPVPEPVTMLGVFLGVSGLAGYVRKRRSA